MIVAFTVEGKPVQWKRAGRNGNRSYTHAPQAAHMQRVGWVAKRTGAWFDDAVHLELLFVLPRPKRPAHPYPSMKSGDLSNLVKLVEDALNGVVWVDDAQVVWCRAEKRYAAPGERPATHVLISDEARSPRLGAYRLVTS